jgi:hypothetical protein
MNMWDQIENLETRVDAFIRQLERLNKLPDAITDVAKQIAAALLPKNQNATNFLAMTVIMRVIVEEMPPTLRVIAMAAFCKLALEMDTNDSEYDEDEDDEDAS